MENVLVSLKVAKKAKAAGFMEFEEYWYNEQGDLGSIQYSGDEGLSDYMKLEEKKTYNPYSEEIVGYDERYYFAPTQALLVKWLIEKHKVIVLVGYAAEKKKGYTFEVREVNGDILVQLHTKPLLTYEEALEEGLYNAFRFIAPEKREMYDFFRHAKCGGFSKGCNDVSILEQMINELPESYLDDTYIRKCSTQEIWTARNYLVNNNNNNNKHYAEKYFASLSNEDRIKIINNYCPGCGSTDRGCQCWNDL